MFGTRRYRPEFTMHEHIGIFLLTYGLGLLITGAIMNLRKAVQK